MIEKEKLKQFTEETSRITGESIKLERKICKCGHVMAFLKPHSQTCSHCGRLVYPNEKIEFKEKLMREIRKHEQVYI